MSEKDTKNAIFAKKSAKYLHMSKKCITFALDSQRRRPAGFLLAYI